MRVVEKNTFHPRITLGRVGRLLRNATMLVVVEQRRLDNNSSLDI